MNQTIIDSLVPLVEEALNNGHYTIFDLAKKFSVSPTDIFRVLRLIQASGTRIQKTNLGAIYYGIET